MVRVQIPLLQSPPPPPSPPPPHRRPRKRPSQSPSRSTLRLLLLTLTLFLLISTPFASATSIDNDSPGSLTALLTASKSYLTTGYSSLLGSIARRNEKRQRQRLVSVEEWRAEQRGRVGGDPGSETEKPPAPIDIPNRKRELPVKMDGKVDERSKYLTLHWRLNYDEGHSTTPVVAAMVVGGVGLLVVGMLV